MSGTRSRWTSAPSSSPISPTALESPPAPQSVMQVYRPRSRAWRMVSVMRFSSMALPICTAPEETVSDSSVELDGGEGRAVDAVAAGAPADDDDAVAGPRGLAALVARDQAEIAAVDQRVADVALVEETAPLTVGMPMRLP